MDRERITISVQKTVLHKIDRVIDGSKIRNRSHAFETLALEALNLKPANNAVILLGGDKALKIVPHAIDFIKKLKDAGFEHITIAVGFLGDKVKETIGDGSDLGIEISYSDKGEGSGGALAALKTKISNTFIVFNCEEAAAIDLPKLLDFHQKHRPLATAAVDELNDLHGIYVLEPGFFEIIPRGFSMLEDILKKALELDKAIVYPVFKD